MVMLEVVHVTKRYRKVLANDDINLTIEANDTVLNNIVYRLNI